MPILSCLVEDCEAKHSARGYCSRHYSRWYDTGSVAEPVVHKTCAECGVAVQRKGNNGPHPKYCSQNCSANASYARRKDAINARRRAENAAKPRHKSACIQCSGIFESKHAAPKFCSTTCNNQWRDAHNDARCSEANCGRGVRAKGLCAMHWRRKARADGREVNSPWDERRKSNYQKRRALKMQLPADDIRPLDVYERDEWVCNICTDPVDRDLSWPDPMSPSLDHVLPLSLGGHHTLENVALAHLSCNVRKGNRVEVDAMSA